jgi:hypothetical protein
MKPPWGSLNQLRALPVPQDPTFFGISRNELTIRDIGGFVNQKREAASPPLSKHPSIMSYFTKLLNSSAHAPQNSSEDDCR